MTGSKKNLSKLGLCEKRELIDGKSEVSVKRQCELLGVNRATYYYASRPESPSRRDFIENVMARIDYWHTERMTAGSRKIARIICREDKLKVGRKLVTRLMKEMGIIPIYPKKNTSASDKKHKKFPYLLRRKAIWLPNQVWAVDITYIKMGRSHMYLTAIIDWYSRFIVGWSLSDTLETASVITALKDAITRFGVPAIINSDQGSQFTSEEYVSLLQEYGVRQSMDGKSRWVDNVIIERWFRSLKCEDIYVNDYDCPANLRRGIRKYVDYYNTVRPHETLDNATPQEYYYRRDWTNPLSAV